MWFRPKMSATCESCGLIFQKARSWGHEDQCICPDCDSLNPASKPPGATGSRALLAAGLLGLLAAASYGFWNLEQRGRETSDLQALADREFDERHYARALELFETLALREAPGPESQFRRAQCLAALGERSEARQIVEEMLARAGTDWLPHTSLVFTDVQFWLAQEIYSRHQVTPAQWKRAEEHLRTVLEHAPHHETARRMLLAMQQATGNQTEALTHLEVLAGSSTADRMALAVAYARVGKTVHATDEAEKVLASLLVELREAPEDCPLRRQAAQAALLAGNFDVAEEQLKRVFRYAGCDDPETVALWVEMCEIQASQLPRDQSEFRQLELCRKSLEWAPHRRQTYEGLRPLLARRGKVGEEARELLVLGLARGCDPVAMHALLAESASRERRAAESALHWSVVVSAQPEWSGALNNLAWELCWSDPPELEDALKYIDRAVQLNPTSQAIRETRGQILARAGRSREALPDLLSALVEFPDNARLHATLSEVNRDLNQFEEAALHARRASELAPVMRFEPVRVPRE